MRPVPELVLVLLSAFDDVLGRYAEGGEAREDVGDPRAEAPGVLGDSDADAGTCARFIAATQVRTRPNGTKHFQSNGACFSIVFIATFYLHTQLLDAGDSLLNVEQVAAPVDISN